MKDVFMTVMMTVYNDISILPIAIQSVQNQTFTNWELLIWDNSDRNPEAWELLKKYADQDSRIHVYSCLQEGEGISVGWAKGSSILLKKAKGEYVFFLAADDLVDECAIEWAYHVANKEQPDVIWCGNAYVTYNEGKFDVLDAVLPEYRVFDGIDKTEEIDYILKNLYYNSMFHYSRVDFLREHNIDFFSPYHGDCVSMTAVLCKAKKMVVLDKITYYLTYNTSQTRGKASMNFFEGFSLQWKLIKEVYEKYQCKNQSFIKYAAERVYRNLEGNIKVMMDNTTICRDYNMNVVNVCDKDRVMQIRNMLKDEYIKELFVLSDKSDYMYELQNLVEKGLLK